MTVDEIKAKYPAFLKHNGVSEPTVVSRPILGPAPNFEVLGTEERCGHPGATMDIQITNNPDNSATAVKTCGLCDLTYTVNLGRF